jgi:poly(A) polymerase Pap1
MPLKTTKQQQPPVDMSAKVGGRIFQPALPVVDGDAPTAAELAFNKSLVAWTHDHIPLETVAGIQTRERVLDRMGVLCREWIQSVCAQKGLSQQVAETAGGSLFTSGSYRLGEWQYIYIYIRLFVMNCVC